MKSAGFLLVLISAIAAPAAAEPSDSDTVFLRDFTVEASHFGWKYATFQNYEVLARCNEEAAQNFARALANSRSLEEELLPPAYLPEGGAPVAAILYEESGELSDSFVPKPISKGPGLREHSQGRIGALNGFIEAKDSDALGICGNLAGGGNLDGLLIFNSGLMDFRLDQYRPRFPLWFSVGLLGPLGFADVVPREGTLEFAKAAWIPRPQAVADLIAAGYLGAQAKTIPSTGSSDVVTLDPYLVEAKTKLLLLPLGEIFRDRRLGEAPPSKLWQAEAGLFLRWCWLEGRSSKKHLKELHQLLEISERGPLSESDFQMCFGFGYGTMEENLAEYLFGAEQVTERIALEHPWPPNMPPIVFKTATDVEVARIVGNWERMRGGNLRPSKPALSKQYLERAQESLQQTYDGGARDPQLLAVFGLLERDLKDTAKAKSLLEAATAAQVHRPAAYIALANLRLAEAQEYPQGAEGHFSAEQVIAILTPIFVARNQATLPYYAYGAIADTWYRSAVRPTAANLAALQEGIACYPRDAMLAYAAARASSKWKYPELTAAFIKAGRRFADDNIAAKLAALSR